MAKSTAAAFVGDGRMAMLMGEFVTCVKYKLPVKVVVLKNNTQGQIKVGTTDVPRQSRIRCDLYPIDFAAFARAVASRGSA